MARQLHKNCTSYKLSIEFRVYIYSYNSIIYTTSYNTTFAIDRGHYE